MSLAVTSISFGEWLPDQPALGNPGLTEALNVYWGEGGYRPYSPLVNTGASLPSLATGAFQPYSANTQQPTIYVGTFSNGLLRTIDAGVSYSTLTAATGNPTSSQFAQVQELVFASNRTTGLIYHTLGSTSTFTSVAAAPSNAAVIGTVGQFLVVADYISGSNAYYNVRWSAIGAPTNWPTPNSATAIATQAGEQLLDSQYGRVFGIVGGDQHATILQSGAITRMTYVGPPAVFQFDVISNGHGTVLRDSIVQVFDSVYFATLTGFYATDGVSVRSISDNRITRYFLANLTLTQTPIVSGVDYKKNLIYWSYVIPGSTNEVLLYNYKDDKWSRSNEASVRVFVRQVPGALDDVDSTFRVFSTSNKLATFSGAPVSATITTGEVEINPGGRAFVCGVKPNVLLNTTTATVAVRVGSRNDLVSSPTYSATTTPNTRTGYADCRVDAKYHRAEIGLTGDFGKALAIEVKAVAAGEA
jgi:hypothetical protein